MIARAVSRPAPTTTSPSRSTSTSSCRSRGSGSGGDHDRRTRSNECRSRGALSGSAMQLEPLKILLVDDTPDNLVVLEALLRRDGVELLAARSGAEALELLLVHEVALALVDVQMPDMDGFELAELMRGAERTRHVPIIFITAGIREGQHVFKGYDAGAVDFLFKPIDPSILKHKTEVFFQ